MAYTPVTPSAFKARFPEFASKDNDYIQLILTEAELNVDDTWLSQANYNAGIMYLTAHIIASSDLAASGGGAGSGGGIASESFGGMSISYDKSASAAAGSSSKWGGTEYGRRFAELVKANKPAIVSI
jgi:hypothetical protein